MFDLAKHRLSFFFFALIFLFGATFLTIQFTKGYRLDLTTKTLKPTGILVVNSSPAGAKVFLNGKFLTATNDSLSLEPGSYTVEIKKNGFSPWKKNLVVEKELVTLADVFLFPEIPDLKPLTFDEVVNPKISPDNTKIVYSIPSPNLNSGLWILDLTESLLDLSKSPRQIAKSKLGSDFAKSNYSWSPDSRQILVEFPSSTNKYLLDSSQLNELTASKEISQTLSKIQIKWREETSLCEKAKIKRLPLKMQEILAGSAADIRFSPDSTKVLYTATASAEIPEKLIPPILGASTQKENRQLEPNKSYVYDIKEDRNFLIPFQPHSPTPTKKRTSKTTTPTTTPKLTGTDYQLLLTPQWFPTSNHVLWIEQNDGENKIVACEYDGTNLTTVYSGPFINPYVFLTPTTTRLIVLTQIGPEKESNPNLFAVSLR